MKTIKFDNKEFIVKDFDDKKGLKIITNKTDEIVFYDEELEERYIENSFRKKYKELLIITTQILEDDDENVGADARFHLNQIDNYIDYIVKKFGKYIDKKTLEHYIKMLGSLKNELERKLEELKEVNLSPRR